jgi:hypothetical protein
MPDKRLLDRLGRSAPAVDTHDVAGLRGAIRRTGVVRVVLVGGAVALVLAAAASARAPETSERPLVPADRIGVVVLDLSLSITDEDLDPIRRTLRRLISEDATIGLVVFSDVPYELLPPGTPAAELQPILRLLVPPRLGSVQNPWTQTFRAGTRVSVALELAKSMLERDHIASGSILLVSDLETAPEDIPALARTIDGLRRADIVLGVVPLGPSSDALRLFEGLLGEDAVARLTPQGPDRGAPQGDAAGAKTPVAFLVLAGLVFVLLAAHERFSGRIALPSARPAEGEPT